MDQITQGYLECALWADLPEEEFEGTIYDCSLESQLKANKEVLAFCQKLQSENLWDELLGVSDLVQIGHDFWLTRNGHGTGFWDRGYGELGEKVSQIAREFGERHVYIQDGNVEIE